jgi:hypothetical protein
MDNNNHLYAVAQVASENEMSKYQLRPFAATVGYHTG